MRERAADDRCPGTEALSRGFRRGQRHPHQAHLEHCLACSRELESLAGFHDLVRELPSASEGNEDVEERRTQLLAIADALPARTSPRRGSTIPVATLAVAAATILVVFGVSGSSIDEVATVPSAETPTAIRRGTIHADPEARWMLVGAQPDEIVRLRDGIIVVDVAPLQAGERFRVVTGDAEVEVRGTAFEVAVAADRLVAVRVRHGHVEVRHGTESITLLAGQRWDVVKQVQTPVAASTHTPSVERDPPPRPRKVVDLAPPPTRAPPPTISGSEHAFQEGIAALQQGHSAVATAAFERALATNSRAGLAEDSRFWLAVARARSGERAAAIRAFEDFLSLHAGSVRAGKASAMLGWLLVEAKDFNGARRRFEAAITDPAEDVRESARAGLAATKAPVR